MNAIIIAGLVGCSMASLAAEEPGASARQYRIEQLADALVIKTARGEALLKYQFRPPAGSKLSVQSGGYFHPLTTPKGLVITDVAPADHPHHRGIFLAWVEIHGSKDADFWGWGEHAPKENRRIVNRAIRDPSEGRKKAGFRAVNDWLAEDEILIEEELETSFQAVAEGHILDLVYTLRPRSELTLARWAFSGFCVRTRRDGVVRAEGPEGAVNLPNPSHLKPESDWPAAAWYDYTLRFEDGQLAGVAVIDHPKNPPALWHNHRDVRMLNPCIVAPALIRLKADQPLTLRYRVVAHDGPAPRELLNRLAREWGRD